VKTLDECRKSVSQAISRAYGVSVWPVEISAEFWGRDARDFVKKTAGNPHADLTVAAVGALTLSRAAKVSADEALASVIADLVDGGVSLDRQAAAPRGLADQMARHRRVRARSNPLPYDLRAQARESAPTVVRRSSGAPVVRRAAPVPTPEARVAAGARVRYKNLADDTEHDAFLGAAPPDKADVRALPLGSPVARALLGATKGTVVPVMLGNKSVELEVLEVQPAASGRG
jgi:transcription elongation GreA/GreB family factor